MMRHTAQDSSEPAMGVRRAGSSYLALMQIANQRRDFTRMENGMVGIDAQFRIQWLLVLNPD